MTDLSMIRILAVCAAVMAGTFAAGEATAEPATAAAEGKPLKLNAVARKPVASSATRTVKKKDGEYARVAGKRRAKRSTVAQEAPPPAAVIATTGISPAAAQAFAAYALARVRVVTSEEAESSRLIADASANGTMVIGVDQVQIVNANDVNHLDSKADTPYAVSLDTLSRDLAGSRNLGTAAVETRVDSESLLQRILVVFTSAFAGLVAMVRALLG